jgi:catechol 2,3-dioxygenase-like lactoylglutathione lyase family enzyme
MKVLYGYMIACVNMSKGFQEADMPKYTGVNHLAFATSDLKTTILFWRDLLGLRLVLTSGKKGYKLYFFELSDDSLVGFFKWHGVEPIEEKEHGSPVKGHFAFDHFSLETHIPAALSLSLSFSTSRTGSMLPGYGSPR